MNLERKRKLLGSECLTRSKLEYFQVNVNVIECKQLPWSNVTSMICVQVEDKKKYTRKRENTDCPYFNEYFVFDICATKESFLEKLLSFTIYQCDSILHPRKDLGSITMDLETVYSQPGHKFLRTWALLLSTEDKLFHRNGFVKCSISVHRKGEIAQISSSVEEEQEGIEMNILSEEQLAQYICKVYTITGMLSMHNRINKKTVQVNSKNNQVDLFVEGATTVRKGINYIEWNEKLAFLTRFPPLFHKLHIFIREGNPSRKNQIIAQHNLSMNEISHDGKEGFLPCFGPANIYLYAEETNKGIIFYFGQLLFSLETILHVPTLTVKSKIKRQIEIIPTLNEDNGKEDDHENLLLFCCLTQASHMDKTFNSNDVHIELNFGTETRTTADGFHGYSNDSICDKSYKNSPSDLCALINRDDKTCLWIQYLWPTKSVYRIHQSNMIAKIVHLQEEKLSKISELLWRNKIHQAELMMDSLLHHLIDHCKRASLALEINNKEDKIGTVLDKKRLFLLKKELDLVQQKAAVLRKYLNSNSVNNIKDATLNLISKIYSLIKEPQEPYPDILVSLIANEKKIAQERIKPHLLMYSSDSEKCGIDCGKKRIFFLKKIDASSNCEYPLAMAVEAYFWMGFVTETTNYLQDLPRGFYIDYEDSRIDDKSLDTHILNLSPPSVLHYYEKHIYQFRAHIFQGRFIPGSDATGLCDPFIKLIFINEFILTQVQYQTLNPLWDQMLTLDDVILCGLPEDIKKKPPGIIIEVMDKDKFGKVEFIGRGFSEPKVTILKETEMIKDNSAKLEWNELYNNGEITGEVLVAFELLQVSDTKEEHFSKADLKSKKIIHVPSYIRPKMVPYSLKVLFWGLRNFGKIEQGSINNPWVTIEVGCEVVNSSVIANIKEYPNFASPIVSAVLELPENEDYAPPLVIKVWDKRSFGRQVHLGSHIVSSISHFCDDTFDIIWPIPIIDGTSSLKEPKNTSKEEYLNDTTYGREKVWNETGGIEKNKSEKETLLKSKERKTTPNKILFKKSNDQNEVAEQDFDWWTKYYESLLEKKENEKKMKSEEMEIIAKYEEQVNKNNDECNAANLDVELSDILPEVKQYDELKSPKSRFKYCLEKFFKKIKTYFEHTICLKTGRKPSESKMEVEEIENPTTEIKVKPASFVIYPNELEKQPEFHGFQEWIECFDIYHGKRQESDFAEAKIVGTFKGSIKLKRNVCHKDETENEGEEVQTEKKEEKEVMNASDSSIIISTPTIGQSLKVLVRTYVIRAYSLTPKDVSGRADPYVLVYVGNKQLTGIGLLEKFKKTSRQVTGDRSEHIIQNLNPIFGRCYELEATLPRDHNLTVCVMDWDMGGHDDLIGITEIDLENRIYSKHRASCGISSSFETSGYNKWRDIQMPSAILENLCRRFHMDIPKYKEHELIVGERSFSIENDVKSKNRKERRETLAVAALKGWSEILLAKGISPWNLVPEHIETRSLYDPKKKSLEQGKLEMWIDLFAIPNDIKDKDAIEGLFGLPIDISPRKPKEYELRVIIWNTADVELRDTNYLFGEKSSDIFVKGWLYGPDIDGQCTDVHYHSLSGEGNFNWRFIFPFRYIAPEKRLVMPEDDETYGKKAMKFMKSLLSGLKGFDEGEQIPCRLQLQIWDEDRFSADDFIGSVSLNLDDLPIGSKTAKQCHPNLLSDEMPRINLFKMHRIRGWWPAGIRLTEIASSENNNGDFKMTGKIDMELHLLSLEEAEASPAGKGRKEPLALPEPKRPDTALTWFANPLKILRLGLLRNYKKRILQCTILTLLVLFLLLGFYSLPGYLIKKIVGA